jgi:hypothetical protein
MSFLRPVNDGSTPRRDSRAETHFPLTGEDYVRVADAMEERARVRRQVEQAQAAVVVRTDLDELDEELESFVTDTAAAPAAMPPVQDGLVLSRDAQHINPCLILCLPNGEILLNYVWRKEEHFTQVCRWISARAAAMKARLPHQFFEDAVLDMYHFTSTVRYELRTLMAWAKSQCDTISSSLQSLGPAQRMHYGGGNFSGHLMFPHVSRMLFRRSSLRRHRMHCGSECT